ncbi:GD17044 [Drosophila simulans]|uniref:GD17044 n=1 Tax=Drosophila simulans TaxID=7240 RepID=B4R367_DROSI|nr:GD17044 [Drosophila simulans]
MKRSCGHLNYSTPYFPAHPQAPHASTATTTHGAHQLAVDRAARRNASKFQDIMDNPGYVIDCEREFGE